MSDDSHRWMLSQLMSANFVRQIILSNLLQNILAKYNNDPMIIITIKIKMLKLLKNHPDDASDYLV